MLFLARLATMLLLCLSIVLAAPTSAPNHGLNHRQYVQRDIIDDVAKQYGGVRPAQVKTSAFSLWDIVNWWGKRSVDA
ncbi:hypothetical protein N0V90_009542 [Kalmusia sp. IMI 367209]|nr:hypothetical protein N0V90_009542 [Kalmusia sp. IMI 367209]